MFDSYRTALRTPGARGFAAAGFVMELPIAVYPIGIVLIISAHDGHYGFAGVLSACYTFGGAVGMPLTSMLVDRLGQRRMLIPGALLHAAAVVALALLVRTSAPHAALVVPAVLVGFTYLSVGALVRARWAHALAGSPELGTALSLQSVLDELIFVLGPLVATLVATQTIPVLVLWVALALVIGGSVSLAVQGSTEPPVHPPDGSRHPFALRSRGMLLLTVASVPMGAVFASAEVSIIAFLGQHGHRPLAGAAVACLALGSGVSGFVYGARPHGGDERSRFRRQAIVFGLLPIVLLAAVDVPVLIVLALVVGAGIAPMLISAFALVQRLVPARALTEGLAWATTGLATGYGVGSALVGGIADAHGARNAFLVVIAAGLLTAALGLLLHVRLRPVGVPDHAVVGAASKN